MSGLVGGVGENGLMGFWGGLTYSLENSSLTLRVMRGGEEWC